MKKLLKDGINDRNNQNSKDYIIFIIYYSSVFVYLLKFYTFRKIIILNVIFFKRKWRGNFSR